MKQLKLGTEAKELEADARKLADQLRAQLPANIGFTLFLFDYGDTGNMTYISTAQRDDMVEVIRNWLKKASP